MQTFTNLTLNLMLFASMVTGIAHADTRVMKQAGAPIQAKDFSYLLGTEGFSDTLLKNHFKLYEAYVKNTNTLLDALNKMSADKTDKTPQYAELKRRLGWEFNGVLLHEYYFENIGKGEIPGDNSPLKKKLAEAFGSFDSWKQDFTATASMRGIGWVVLYVEPRTGKVVNEWINEHDTGHLCGATPLLILDVFEHAYITDYQLDKPKYIENFLKNINWKVVEERFNKLSQ